MFAFFQNLVYAFPMTNPKSTKKSSPGEKVSELPDGPANEHGLTPRQAKILDVIRTAIETNGYPPSMREIGQAAGLASPASVSYQLETLVEKGFIRRDATKGRALEITYPSEGKQSRQRRPATFHCLELSLPVLQSWPRPALMKSFHCQNH